jgi:hypothetical protein
MIGMAQLDKISNKVMTKRETEFHIDFIHEGAW